MTRLRETFEIYRKPIIAGVVAVVVVVAAVIGVLAWRSEADSQARVGLADAMAVERAQVAPALAPGATTPPPPAPAGSFPNEKARNEAALAKFMAVATQYPSADAGITARYHAAALLTLLGRQSDALQRYQEVIDRAGSSLYGEMARLGIADVQVAAGQWDKAIATYKEMSARKDGKLPVDGILMQLGRAYGAAGKPVDAKQTFKRIADEFPQSPYAADAKREMDAIKG
ncbi:MAG TPA: tetratricopeptide repeat protein [Vicinamibacterales bacterium]